MMTKGRRFFTDEFKQEAVALLESSGRPLEHIAKELDIQPWCCATGADAAGQGAAAVPHTAGGGPLASGDQAAEIARLKRELERVRMERDILKKKLSRSSQSH